MAKSSAASQLDSFINGASGRKFRQKGGLCVALVVTRKAIEGGLPLNPEKLLTPEGGQVSGLGIANVRAILKDHGITKVLAREGGRTSRGSILLMRQYVSFLNGSQTASKAQLRDVEAWWISRVRDFFASEGPAFSFDPSKSLHANLTSLFNSAREIQGSMVGSTILGSFLQHMVGAKLDLVLGDGKLSHHGASAADAPTDRPGDFHFGGTVVHVTTLTSPGLMIKCRANLEAGLNPVIITMPNKIELAHGQMELAGLENRVDVLDVMQFLTASILERSELDSTKVRPTLLAILTRYNEIVRKTETDPSLLIRLP
jgi:hypothetical protein